MTYIKPSVFAKSFTCPHSNCGAIAKQDWQQRLWANNHAYPDSDKNPLRIGTCQHCGQSTVWVFDKMWYPDVSTSPRPNREMPPDILKLYQEAASISGKSPRGAAALLRLAIQKLCIHLGEPGKDINIDIGSLVKKGLPELVQQSLDIVRVTGNEAVHPGQVDTDDAEVVEHLFNLVNIIVENRIAEPKKISGLYQALPANKLKGIADRDKVKTP
jgi:hypothetical protein